MVGYRDYLDSTRYCGNAQLNCQGRNEVWLIGERIGKHPGAVTDKIQIYNLDTGSSRAGPRTPTDRANAGFNHSCHEYRRSVDPTHVWNTEKMLGASDGEATTTNLDIGALRGNANNSPEVSYLARFETAGTWYLWIRGRGDTNAAGEGRSDSVHAGLNGSLASSADNIHHFPSNWSWSSSTRDRHRATLNVPSAGTHAVNLWIREDGLELDRLALSFDESWTLAQLSASESVASSASVDSVQSTPSVSNQASTTTVETIDASRSWNVVTTSNRSTVQRRHEAGGVELNGKMTVSVGEEVIVMGGESLASTNAHNQVEAYNVRTNQWQRLQSLRQARHGGVAAVLDDKIHVAAGASAAAEHPNQRLTKRWLSRDENYRSEVASQPTWNRQHVLGYHSSLCTWLCHYPGVDRQVSTPAHWSSNNQ